MVLILFFGNLYNRNQAVAIETKIPQTTMAHLVNTEFGNLPIEQLVEETASPASMLSAGKEKYVSNSCSLEKQNGLSFVGQLSDNTDNNDLPIFSDNNDSIFKPSTIIMSGDDTAPTTQRTEIIYYTVQNGDAISTIARKFGITSNTIIWANNLNAYGFIRPGDKLTILPYSGILYTVKRGDTVAKIAKTYNIDVDKILSCNNVANGLTAGEKIIVPGARRIVETIAVVKPTTQNRTGISIISNLIQSSPSKTVSAGKMTWPTEGHHLTQYFSWRHPGVDIANKSGTPVYAAADGVVIFAGWATGYGNSIVIDHGNGIKTRYGHSSKLFVKVGDEVTKGENIMAMGSTGWSTGPHLHFEVIVSGTRYNPLNYIK